MTSIVPAAPLSSGFTYQGFLQENGLPANGIFDLEFRLYNADSSTISQQQGGTIVKEDVAVSDGRFVAKLIFGEADFNGDER